MIILDNIKEEFNVAKTQNDRLQRHGREAVRVLNEIADEIQREEDINRIGKLTYSSFGVVGGVLTIVGIALTPVTFGVSLALSIAGASTGATAGLADLIHGSVTIGIQITKLKQARKLLQKVYDEMSTTEKKIGKLYSSLELLKQIGESHILGILPVVDSIKTVAEDAIALDKLRNLVPKKLITNGVAKIPSTVAIPLAAAGIVFDISTIARTSIRVHKKEVYEYAKKLRQSAKELEMELQKYKDIFSE